MLVVVLAWSILTALGGGLYFTSHEADMIHLTDLVFRQSAGEVFHTTIATPVGGWATLPMSLVHRGGLGVGAAMVWGQIAVLAVLSPLVVAAVANRLTPGQSLVFILLVSSLISGLVSGGGEPLVSLSMSYNRWCWAATLIIVLVVVLPGQPARPVRDGLVIGLLMAGMAMVKVSYPVALALPVVFGLLRNGRTASLGMACITAVAILSIVTAVEGTSYWEAYLADMLTVAGSSLRAAPGADWSALILSPTGLPATLVVVAMIVLSGRIDRPDLGATLLLFFGAFTVITWQNFGNDPIWLAALAMVAWVLSTQGQGSARRAMRTTAVVAAVLILPVMLNIFWSPVRHLTLPSDQSRPMLAADPSLRLVTARADTIVTTNTVAGPDVSPTEFRGEALPDCQLTSGLVAMLERDADALTSLVPGINRQPLVADLFQSHWLFAGLRPLDHGTPWYYDGLPGLADATHVMVPDCPADLRARARIVELLEEADVPLEKAGRTETFRLYRIAR